MRYRLSTAFLLLTGVAVLMTWLLAPFRQPAESYEWNQSLLPYHASAPDKFMASTKGPISIPRTVRLGPFFGPRTYPNPLEMFHSEHLSGWNYACRIFTDSSIEPVDLRPLKKLPLQPIAPWAKEEHEAFEIGFRDARADLIRLSGKYDSESLRSTISSPTPWHYPNGRAWICTLLFGALLITRLAIPWMRQITKR